MRRSEQQRLMRLAVGELRKCVVETHHTLTAARARLARGRSLSAQARMRIVRGTSDRGMETPSPNHPGDR